MKMVKHCHEESSNMDLAQGALLGLVVDKCLEITNCFPFPKTGDETMDEEMYQLTVMRRLRRVNVDHLHVGWYQSSDVGNSLSLALLESQYHYQTSIEESVVVVYDTQKSSRGFLCLKAYRLTPQAIQMYKDGDFTPEAFRTLKVGYESLFAEIPIVIKNSPLTNIMMSELNELLPEDKGHNFLDLGTASVLENHMRSLIERVDELYQEAVRYNKYQQVVFKQDTVSELIKTLLVPFYIYTVIYVCLTGETSCSGQVGCGECCSHLKGRTHSARGGGHQGFQAYASPGQADCHHYLWTDQYACAAHCTVLFSIAG